MSGLELLDVSVGYTHAPVLHGVSLTVGPHEIVGLLGANGAGKTTLLRTVAGVLRSWRGDVRLDDVSIARATPWRRVRAGIAHVPEGRHVFTAMTVEENLDVAGLVGSDPAGTRARVVDLFPRLEERRRQLAGSLSGGEQQMLAIGRALMTEPRVLLVDEMSAGLAPVMSQSLVDGLVRIHDQGVGILIVEQSPELIAGIVSRLYLLERGRIVAGGTLEEIGGTRAIADLYLGTAPKPRPGGSRRRRQVARR
jgi:branched-chain amino acid transport system ATP-binding protein